MGTAQVAVVFAELERDFIRMRTREAMQVKKENGVTLGRPRSTPDDVVARRARARGWQDGIRHRPRPQPRCRADCAGCARLVASHGPRGADAGRRSLITAIFDCVALI
jgi:hypothetical protein